MAELMEYFFTKDKKEMPKSNAIFGENLLNVVQQSAYTHHADLIQPAENRRQQ